MGDIVTDNEKGPLAFVGEPQGERQGTYPSFQASFRLRRTKLPALPSGSATDDLAAAERRFERL